ncbi:MAG: LysE family transporter [Thermacetogeniaceae bacterium]
MYLPYFSKGLIIGLSIAAPVGPIGVLCIQRTLTEGTALGLASGLGAALADGLYGAIAGFGLTFVSGFLLSHQSLIRLLGGIFLCYLGLRAFFKRTNFGDVPPLINASHPAKPEPTKIDKSDRALFSTLISTFFLTLTNPLTIVFFTGVFAGLGVVDTGRNYTLALALVLGVFMGSALWWVILTFGTSILRDKLHLQKLQWINRVSGLIMLGFGIIALSSLIGAIK